MMEFNVNSYLQEAQEKVRQCEDLNTLKNLESFYLGRKSHLNKCFQNLKFLTPLDKITQSQHLNEVKQSLFKLFRDKKSIIEERIWDQQLKQERLNLNLNPLSIDIGAFHPLNILTQEITTFFTKLGYSLVSGQELEYDVYNFQKLNIPAGHPARANHDSFYIDDKTLLRTHCTNVTARMIEKLNFNSKQKYFGWISMGNVYRKDDDDATHSHQFRQMDGVLIGYDISFSHLKWTLQELCNTIFGEKVTINFRPSYFPFTEPSVELDVACPYCQSKGCGICKFNGFIEVLGAGMINPNVFKECGQSESLKGFAFGIGLERIAMIKYGINDIRNFYKNDIRFLKQFRNI